MLETSTEGKDIVVKKKLRQRLRVGLVGSEGGKAVAIER